MPRRPDMDDEIAAVRRLLGEVSGHLDPECIAEVEELLANEEPNEALLVIAWNVADQRHEFADATI